jgi:nucleoside-diphosphate-sugar epimerase
MRCLITGATGFIGRRLVRRLIDRIGIAAVACLVGPAASEAELEALKELRSTGIRVIEGDLRNQEVARVTPPDVDAVFHFAANVDTAASGRDLRINDHGSDRLLGWIGPALRGGRIVYASTIAVHDRGAAPCEPICEDSPLTPRTEYGRSKLRGERIVRARSAIHGYSWTILRLPTVYGPGQKEGGLFDRLGALASRDTLLGRINWPGRTSIVHVDDVVEAAIALASNPAAAGQEYCVASDDVVTVGDIARACAEATGYSLRSIDVPPRIWRAARTVAWSPHAARVVPPAARVWFWRLSLVISDGFWLDTRKFRSVYPRAMKTLREGLSLEL